MSPKEQEQRQLLAQIKLATAKVLVEQAQNDLGKACVELSDVVGAMKEWDRLSKLMQRVKDEWYRLDKKFYSNAKKSGLILDRTPTEKDLARLADVNRRLAEKKAGS